MAKFDDWWPQSIQAYYRYDYFNPNENVATLANHDDTAIINSIGLNWFFAQTTKLQLGLNNWNYKIEAPNKKDFTELQAQLQYTF